jgi:outer membrane murein-binding lipoprotein Lpp
VCAGRLLDSKGATLVLIIHAMTLLLAPACAVSQTTSQLEARLQRLEHMVQQWAPSYTAATDCTAAGNQGL